MAGPKFWTAALLAFISLSGAAGEPRRCYWCGPLAEQVHRSRRSAACRGADPVTACEPGYNYCAVVATSPPRVESRFCVKVYQDECYPLYCNSTKTWKMTCPCRGDLCNGPNTDRETEAFALLPKLVAKTHNARIKKRTAFPSPHLIKHRRLIDTSESDNQKVPDKLVVTEDENPEQLSNNVQSDQPNIIEHHEDLNTQSVASQDAQTTTSNNQLIEILIHVSDPTAGSDKINDAEHLCIDSSSTTPSDVRMMITETAKHENLPVITTADSGENNEASLKPTNNNVVAKSDEPIKTTEAIKQDAVDVETTKKPQPAPPMKTTEITPKEEPTKSLPPEDEMQNDAPIINPTNVQSMETTQAVKVEVQSTKNSDKPSEPTAEALQHDGSSAPVTEKSIQTTTTEATTITTVTTQENTVKITATPISKRKNNSVKITFSFSVLLCCIIIVV